MIGRRATVGLSLLCALLFSAFAVQSASAQKGTPATNTTAVTCIKGGGDEDFSDSHCDKKVEKGKGEYGHVAFTAKPGETTEIEVVNQAGTVPFLKGVLAGVNTEVECTKAASVAKKAFIENTEKESKHGVKGNIEIQFTGCTVKKPTKCKIKEPIVTSATFEGVEALGANKNEMGVEFKGSGAGGAFAELLFENSGGTCSLLNGGKAFLVLGSAIATGNTPAPTDQHSGATSKYIPNKEVEPKEAEEMQTLEIGTNKKQYFTAEFTTTMAGGGNPISLTTLTKL
jgi:hypothetical protein